MLAEEAEEAPPPEIPPLLSPDAVDNFGIRRLISGNIRTIRFVEVYRSLFAHPDREYTGYAQNGFWYTNGVLDSTHDPAQATWAITEGGGENRSGTASMPDRILVTTTFAEVCIFNADTLDVWMRFLIPTSIPSTIGNFLGKPDTKVFAADFYNGFLVVVTDEGLKIANFRADEAYFYSSSDVLLADNPLQDRNDTEYMDDSSSISDASRLLSGSYCLCISSNSVSNPVTTTKRGYTIAAVGHTLGFDGLILAKPGLAYPEAKNVPISRSFSAPWEAVDDGDGDTLTPLFIDDTTNWVGLGVEAGDVLVTDTPTTHIVTEVNQTVPGHTLILDPPLTVGATGSTYSVYRRVPAVKVDLDGSLYFANGDNRITKIDTSDWFEGGTAIFSNLTTAFPTSDLGALTSDINALAVVPNAGEFYVATSVGVFYGTDQDLENSAKLEYRYSTLYATNAEATYKILVGLGEAVGAVAVDPETGSVAVSVNEIEADVIVKSVVSEINVGLQQTFRYFDNVGVVRDIAAYRNPLGPPDVEVT